MNKSESIIKKVDEATTKTANVHPDGVQFVDDYLGSNKIPHTKKKLNGKRYGLPFYYGYTMRPEAWQPFLGSCSHTMCTSPSGNVQDTASGYTGDATGGNVGAT